MTFIYSHPEVNIFSIALLPWKLSVSASKYDTVPTNSLIY